jgi:putative peptidoglycan lipid II flippase
MKKSIFTSALVGVLALIASFITILRDKVVASEFGIGEQVDVFFLTVTIITFGLGIFSSLSNNGFMPVYIKQQEKALIGDVTIIHLLFSFLLSFIIITTWVLLERPYLEMLIIITLSLPIFAISTVLASIHQSQKKYALVNFVGLIPNSLCIFSMIIFKNSGMTSASLGLLSGYIAVLLVLIGKSNNLAKNITLNLNSRAKSLIEVINNYKALILGVVIMSSNNLIDQIMALNIGEGAISTLAFGGRVANLVFGVTTTIMTTILVTEFTLRIREKNHSSLRVSINSIEKLVLILSIIITGFVFCFSEQIIDTLFNHGSISNTDLELISLVQKAYIIQIPFYACGLIYANLLIALEKSSILTKVATINLILNVGLNYILGSLFGVVGIATSTTIVYAFTFGYLKIKTKNFMRENSL